MFSKTYAAAVVLGVITAIDMNTQFLSQFVAEAYRPWLLMVWPITMMTLREMTDSDFSEDKVEDKKEYNVYKTDT